MLLGFQKVSVYPTLILLDFVVLRYLHLFPLFFSVWFPLLLDGDFVPRGFEEKTEVFRELQDHLETEQVELLWLSAVSSGN